jgi:hypothetical protein
VAASIQIESLGKLQQNNFKYIFGFLIFSFKMSVHSISEVNSIADNSLTRPTTRLATEFSMELDPDVNSACRQYPAIGDYYRANAKTPNKPIQLQAGLSNYSSLQLGDDRIGFTESILSATYRIPVECKMAISSPSKGKTRNLRKREYQDAQKKVGDVEINRLERVMKDKLFQRSYATSSPFQVRKAFKFFDREQLLRIPIEGFTKALEFLGFQFAELQNIALFARYDTDFSGEIDYMNFIATAMFYPAIEPDFGQHRTVQAVPHEQIADAPDFDANELRQLQQAELRSIWNKVDRERRFVKLWFSLLLTRYYRISMLCT